MNPRRPSNATRVLLVPCEKIRVDTTAVIRSLSVNPIGININYLRDKNCNRPTGTPRIQSVLKKMNVGWLRYPGGEKSDFHFFAKPPYTRADPQVFGPYLDYVKGRDLLNFDQYMRYVRAIGAHPFVVVAYDSLARTGKTKEEFLAHAVAWVRYANITRKYGIMHWEIGNENWHNKTGTAQEIGQVAREFSRAMKAVDPRIRTGCSGIHVDWFKTLLEIAGPDLDFVTVSNYVGWPEGFARYADPAAQGTELDNMVREAAAAIAQSPHRNRIQVVASEFNAVDFTKGWPWKNDLGHAIVTFDMAGEFLCNDRVLAAMLWNTRWVEDHKPVTMWYALGRKNEILPAGRPLAIWGEFLKQKMVKTSGPAGVRTYASFDPKRKTLTVFIINRTPAKKEVHIEVNLKGELKTHAVYSFAGKNPQDMHPTWKKLPKAKWSGVAPDTVRLPPTSITVVDMRCKR